jgi:two-component system NtrC family sensor kinase
MTEKNQLRQLEIAGPDSFPEYQKEKQVQTHNLTKPTTKMLDLCRAVTEISPMPIVAIEDAAHRVSYVNPAFCALVGKSEDELMGTNFSSIPMIGDHCLSLLDRVYRSGQAESHTIQERFASYPSCSYAMWPILSTETNLPGVILQVIEESSVQRDAVAMNAGLMLGLIRQQELTDTAEALNTQLHFEMAARLKAEEALIKSEKLASVGRMSAVIAHEINNPLAAVMDLLYLVERVEGVPATALEYLTTVDGELKRIAHITRQTLGFYREIVIPETFNVASLLDSVISLFQAKIKSTQAILNRQCDKELQFSAIHGELRQVFSNLLANSLDAVGERGKVTLRASLSRNPKNENGQLRITVADNGKGIGQASLLQIFEAFYTTKGSIGNGLGLWVSKQIIEKHGGNIQVRSSTNGAHQGTSFSVTLPVSNPHSKAAS